jgi:hypothetical protein
MGLPGDSYCNCFYTLLKAKQLYAIEVMMLTLNEVFNSSVGKVKVYLVVDFTGLSKWIRKTISKLNLKLYDVLFIAKSI